MGLSESAVIDLLSPRISVIGEITAVIYYSADKVNHTERRRRIVNGDRDPHFMDYRLLFHRLTTHGPPQGDIFLLTS